MQQKSFWRLAGITLLSWLSVIGLDFLLHASILAPSMQSRILSSCRLNERLH
ncbi:MAG: hypothetical protein WA997_09880 [Anaerolineales bacterium]|nr:hypothetical protein [Anaerolineales bacterium]